MCLLAKLLAAQGKKHLALGESLVLILFLRIVRFGFRGDIILTVIVFVGVLFADAVCRLCEPLLLIVNIGIFGPVIIKDRIRQLFEFFKRFGSKFFLEFGGKLLRDVLHRVLGKDFIRGIRLFVFVQFVCHNNP